MVFGIGSALKKLGRSFEKETKRALRSTEKEAFREVSDIVKVSTLGILDPNEIKRLGKQQKALAAQAEKEQLKRKRLSLVEQAKLQDEIAQRGATRARGGRFSLLSGGEQGLLVWV